MIITAHYILQVFVLLSTQTIFQPWNEPVSNHEIFISNTYRLQCACTFMSSINLLCLCSIRQYYKVLSTSNDAVLLFVKYTNIIVTFFHFNMYNVIFIFYLFNTVIVMSSLGADSDFTYCKKWIFPQWVERAVKQNLSSMSFILSTHIYFIVVRSQLNVRRATLRLVMMTTMT